MAASDEREAVRLLRDLMEDAFTNWRTMPSAHLTMAEQEAREFLLRRGRSAPEQKSEAQA